MAQLESRRVRRGADIMLTRRIATTQHEEALQRTNGLQNLGLCRWDEKASLHGVPWVPITRRTLQVHREADHERS